MDRGLVHKSSPLVGEMGEAGHGWWSVNNLRPPFEQQHDHPSSLFMPSTTTATAPSSSSSPLHSFSSLLLSNHYPLPTTSTSPWHHDSGSTSSHAQQGLGQQDSWSQLIQVGLATDGEKRYKQEGQMLFPVCSEAGGSGGSYLYSAATASHGSSTSDEIQLPWGSGVNQQQHHKALQKKAASSPRSSSITSTTSLGSNMLEFSNNSSSPRESISTASGSAFKKARTQEPSPAQSTVKVRKEKLGDRITALHQLVSPFGKTDTASVLLEAIGYIRFLHSQIEALSSPYVDGSSSSNGGGGGPGSSVSSGSKLHQHQLHLHEASVHGERHSIFPEDPGQLLHDSALKKRGQQPDEQDGSCEEAKKDLRSRGLCLVPVSCTLDVGVVDVVAGPADYWAAAAAAPAFGMGFGG